MKWETHKLPNGQWGVFLCKKYWKFKDRPVIYCASITQEGAEQRVHRLNNPGQYSFDENYISSGMVREKKKREKAQALAEAKAKKAEAKAKRDEARHKREAERAARHATRKKK